ncbi:hypothetical protein [Streptomyces sp. SP18CS02]|uniref:hypothetical protein n=1 Tax=Streptomyces sp. SP18CS02 TaxID=3002531 RepID=UPI002E759CBE|nr:hypothetical protein [Streptomyces sp. SP18CS02]MEE1753039.1 hypothetical protein [Streptomyces sp. SP18CS02]
MDGRRPIEPLVDLGELLLRSGEADLEALDHAVVHWLTVTHEEYATAPATS